MYYHTVKTKQDMIALKSMGNSSHGFKAWVRMFLKSRDWKIYDFIIHYY